MRDSLVEPSELVKALSRFSDARVAVIGDIMLDCYVYGEVERISPEAPVPVLRVRDRAEILGGCGNVVRNVAALGAKVSCVSVVGDDLDGDRISTLLGLEERVRPFLVRSATRCTSRKTRMVAGGQQLLRVDHELIESSTTFDEDATVRHYDEAFRDAHVVVLSDYGKGAVTRKVIRAAMATASALGIPVLVDPKGKDFAKYEGATLITPNKKELAEATGFPVNRDFDVASASKYLLGTAGVGAVLATRGAEGMTLVDAQGQARHIRSEAREVFDVSGAGDTVIATVAVCLSAGFDVLQAVSIANLAAGLVVGKAGTAVVYPDELVAALARGSKKWESDKFLTAARVAEQVQLWRRSGKRIGLASGSFDLLHPGHLHMINHARSVCDRLIVAVNSDASTQQLRGNGRPIQSELERVTVVAGLAGVDAVTVQDDPTHTTLVRRLRPDALIGGVEYAAEHGAGVNLVREYGGFVALAEMLPGFSTSAIAGKLSRGARH